MTPATPASHIEQIRMLYDRAHAALRAGDAAAAETVCRRALPTYRKDPNIMCLLGEAVLQQRRPQEAQTWYGKVLKQYRDFPRALEGMGLALLAGRKPVEAAGFLRKAAEAAPQRATTRFALGRALAASGHVAEAEQAFAEALELDPSKVPIAEAAEAQREGRMEEAEKLLRETLEKDPDSVTALRMLGNLAVEAARWKQAEALLERTVELAPEFILAWNDLANLYLKQDRYDEALAAVDRALALDRGHPHSWVMQGNILTKAQRHEEALAAYDKALEVNPNNGGALSGRGHVLKTIGRRQESIDAYRKCIRAHPGFGEAYWSLANLKTFEFTAEEAEVMEAMAGQPDLPDEPKVNFLMALGKHWENEGDYDRAFDCYRRGNALRRAHEIYDPVHTQVIHDRIIGVFSHDFLASRAGSGDADPSPILVVGLPRSGSTLIEQILASHSQVEGTMELPDLSRVIGKLNRQPKRGGEYPEAVEKLSLEDTRMLGRTYLESTSRYRTGKPRFIDKMPNNFAAVGFLQLVLPNAKVIDARRHPLDSCFGSYKQLFFKGQTWTYDLFEIGHYYLQYRRIMDHWDAVLPGKVLRVEYEDVVADLEGQARRMLEYLGLPWEDRCLRFWETERAVNTASSEQVRQPIYTGSVGAWKRFEKHLGELIDVLGPVL